MHTNNNQFKSGMVSIITPVYNNESYLSEMLDSVLMQTYDSIQMILVDDGSTDKTAETAEAYAEKFAERGYEYSFIRAEHKNASAAISAGLPLVKGEYLIWPDSDDLLLADSVEKRVNFLKENPLIDSVRSLPEYFDSETGEAAAAREPIENLTETHIFRNILDGCTFVSCGCYMLKSSLFFDIYPERKIPVYDVGQNFQMLLPYMYFHTCATIEQVLYRVRVHDNSHSVRKLTLKEKFRVIDEFSALLEEIAVICNIKNKEDLECILRWRKRRRNALKRHIFRNLPIIKQIIKLRHNLREQQ